MKYSVHLYALAFLTFVLTYGFNWFQNKLIEAIPLEEIEITIQKKHWPAPPYPLEDITSEEVNYLLNFRNSSI